MFNRVLLAASLSLVAANSYSQPTPIVGNVQSKCVITTDTSGVYSNPTADVLTTNPSEGGVLPVVRFDVSLAGAYKGKISYPTSFSSSPTLNDVVNWTGSVEVDKVSDTAMSDYDTTSIAYDAVTEYDLHTSGSTWFKIDSTAKYGYGKAFPGGQYTALVMAECIAK
jgi:hypothetical protein